jgi:hypothetical protein
MPVRSFAALFMMVAATAVYAADGEVHVTRAQRAACMPDAVRLCRDAMPNLRRVVTCFLGHRDKLSNRCTAVLASYGL